MSVKRLIYSTLSTVLIFSISTAPAQSAPPAPPHTLVKQALKQIRSEWSHLLPSGTWGSGTPTGEWDGSDAGLTEGNHQGWGGNATTTVPFVRFDNVDVMTVPNWNGTPQQNANPGGLTNGIPPYSANGRVGIWLNAGSLDSDLLFIKTALFHELVHVAQWRDKDSTWTPGSNGTVYSGERERRLFELKEVEASARTLKFLQGLLKKREFSEKRIRGMVSDQMANLQKHLREAASDAETLKGNQTDRDLLKRMLPKDLVALILMKKFATYGWADDGILTNEDIAHIHYVAGLLDKIDSARDGVVAEKSPPAAMRDAMLEARTLHELRNSALVRSVTAWEQGRLTPALRALDLARRQIVRTANGEDPEITRGALLFTDALETALTGNPLPAPDALITWPPPGFVVYDTVQLDVEDSAFTGNITDVVFYRFGPCDAEWRELGQDLTALDGWNMDWDTTTAPSGYTQVAVDVWTADGHVHAADTAVIVDNVAWQTPAQVELLTPSPGEVGGIVFIEATAFDPACGEPTVPPPQPIAPIAARFEICADSPEACWVIGIDDDPTDGFSFAWDSATVTDGPLHVRAVVIDESGAEALDSTGIYVVNDGEPLP